MNCIHWSDCQAVDGGCCQAGHYGGQPALSVCTRICKHRVEGPPAAPTIRIVEPEPVVVPSDVRSLIWDRIHARPILAAKLSDEKKWLQSLIIPCGVCRTEWEKMWPGADLCNRMAYARSGYEWHNAVNRKLNKPEMSFDDAAAKHGWDKLIDEPLVAFDRVVWINLDRRRDRREKFEKQLASWPFSKPERFSAFDGREANPPEGWKSGSAVWGCLQSHLAVVRAAIERGDNSILILEDDAIWRDGFPEAAKRFVASAPNDWHALFFGHQPLGETTVVAPGIRRTYAPHRLHAYALRGPAMRAVVECWSKVDDHADHAIKDLLGKKFITYAADPHLIAQSASPSDIGSERVERWWKIEETPDGRKLDSIGLTFTKTQVGHGQVGLNGNMGFDAATMALAPPSLKGWETISAHADSRILVNLDRSVEVAGFINASALISEHRPVEFWIDHNWLGSGSGAGDFTMPIVMEPGGHVLQTSIMGPSSADRLHHRHSVWALRPAVERVRAQSNQATPDNTAIVVLGEYPSDRMHDHLRLLARSVSKQAEMMHVFGEGVPYKGHYQAKVVNLLEHLRGLPAHFTHVLHMDGLDTLLVRPLAAACEAFNGINHHVVVSAEFSCWPAAQIAEAFPAAGPAGRYINAGEFMGQREAVEKLLSELIELYGYFSQTACPLGLEKFWMHRGHRGNDQWLWQVRYLIGGSVIELDREGLLFANVTTTDMNLAGNTHYDFTDDGRVFLKSGPEPCVLHFSGWGHPDAHHQWAGYLRKI